MFVEEEFGIITEDNEIIPENFDSVSKLSRFTRSKMDSNVAGNTKISG